MSISYEGIGHLSVTFPNNDAVEEQVCGLNGNGQTVSCSDGDCFLGKVESAKGDKTAVQIAGFVNLPYTGTAPAVGYTKLSANGVGGIQADTNGNPYWVVAVDTATKIVTMIL